MVSTVKSFISLTKTCGDTATPYSYVDIPFFEGNFHIYTNPVNYGDGNVMSAVGIVNSVISFPKGNLRDIFFKNQNAGSNGVVVFVGTIENEFVNKFTKY